mmetsp:Transcript_35040/g.71536  ORF Transcript_35040/g.71536 Transcript_35040/m.71536 type:complete len:220 (-) Transcript_35040:773-1432(-)
MNDFTSSNNLIHHPSSSFMHMKPLHNHSHRLIQKLRRTLSITRKVMLSKPIINLHPPQPQKWITQLNYTRIILSWSTSIMKSCSTKIGYSRNLFWIVVMHLNKNCLISSRIEQGKSDIVREDHPMIPWCPSINVFTCEVINSFIARVLTGGDRRDNVMMHKLTCFFGNDRSGTNHYYIGVTTTANKLIFQLVKGFAKIFICGCLCRNVIGIMDNIKIPI